MIAGTAIIYENMVKCAEDLIKLIHNKKVYIYGTGFVGKRFYHALQEQALEKNVISFVVTNKSEQRCCGLKVQSLSDITSAFRHDTDLVCIATHESISKIIIDSLIKSNIKGYVWIYPFLHELLFGKPIFKNVEISVKDLLSSYEGDYAIPVRVLAIEQFYGKNDNGYEIYKKGMSLHCEETTANRRLSQFVELIKRWEREGYDSKSHIKITEKGKIFDGAHRLALAYYHGFEKVYCDVFHVENYDEYITSEVCVSEKDLRVFLPEEKEQLRKVSDFIKNYAEKRI